ncbi:unnamed protein product, partial [Darwinula stevensoni]
KLSDLAQVDDFEVMEQGKDNVPTDETGEAVEAFLGWGDIALLVIIAILGIYWLFFRNRKPAESPTKSFSIAPTSVPARVNDRNFVSKMKNSGRSMVVFYGSQTGTAEEFANRLMKDAKRYGMKAMVADPEECEMEDLGEVGTIENNLSVFCMATYGEGDPTDNAQEFYDWLQNGGSDLNGLNYAVFGLGNKTYEHYNAMGKFVDKKLSELGAIQVFELGLGDDDGNMEEDFITWKEKFWQAVCEHFGLEASAEELNVRQFRLSIHQEIPSDRVFVGEPARLHSFTTQRPPFDAKNPYMAPLVELRELHKGGGRSCMHIELNVEGSRIRYEAGDHVAVFPTNNNMLVERLAQLTGTDLDIVISLVNVDDDSHKKHPFPCPCSYRTAFLHYVDISSAPRTHVLKELAEYCSDEKEKRDEFEKLRDMLIRLLGMRKNIVTLKDTVPQDEWEELLQNVIVFIDHGNRILGLDQVLRGHQFKSHHSNQSSLIQLYDAHDEAHRRIDEELEKFGKSSPEQSCSLCIRADEAYGNLKGQELQLIFSLYSTSHQPPQRITDSVILKPRCNPQQVGVFLNVSTGELMSHRLFLMCRVIHVGLTLLPEENSKGMSHQMSGWRRPVGIAGAPLPVALLESPEEMRLFLPCILCGDRESLDATLTRFFILRDASPKSIGISVILQAVTGDLNKVKEQGMVEKDFVHVPLLGADPGNSNDLYVTILQGEFSKGNKRSEKNVEGAVTLGRGSEFADKYSSYIYYHSNKPVWNETFCILIPWDTPSACHHLKFTFRHRSSVVEKDRQKPFAISYLLLVDNMGRVVECGTHALPVFKILDPRKWHENDMGYLKLSGIGKHPIYSLSQKESFTVSTTLSSNKLTSNRALVSFIEWPKLDGDRMVLLNSLQSIPNEEIIKFIPRVLDSIFRILDESRTSRERCCFPSVLKALVQVMSVTGDARYRSHAHLKVELYIAEEFYSRCAYRDLLCSLVHLVQDYNEVEQLRRTLKYIEPLARLISRSWVLSTQHFEVKNGEKDEGGRHEFEKFWEEFFQGLCDLVSSTSDHSLVLPGEILKYLPAITSHLLNLIHHTNIACWWRDLLDVLPTWRLPTQELLSLLALAQSPLFTYHASRLALLPLITHLLKERICCQEGRTSSGSSLYVSGKSGSLRGSRNKAEQLLGLSVADIWKSEVELMMQLLKSVLLAMWKDRNEGISEEVSHLSQELLSPLMGMLLSRRKGNQLDSLTDQLTVVVVILLDLMSESDYLLYLRGDNTSLFPGLLTVERAEVFLEFMQNLFDPEKPLFSNSQQRMKLLPMVIGPFLEMSLIPKETLREQSIPLFFDIIQCVFSSPRSDDENALKSTCELVENELVNQVDHLFGMGRGDDAFKDQFHSILTDLSFQHEDLRDSATKMIEVVVEQMNALLQYWAVTREESHEMIVIATVSLMNFYERAGHLGMYIKYLYKLYNLHIKHGKDAEAAFTLLLHSNLLSWKSDTLTMSLTSPHMPHISSQAKLKEDILKEAIKHFDSAMLWEEALKVCQELEHLYKSEVLDYCHLSWLLQSMAGFYDAIMNRQRPEPHYFRVALHGKGFPPLLQNTVFVHRGHGYEQLATFNDRMLAAFPNADLLQTLDVPQFDIQESSSQYLQINKVDPVPSPEFGKLQAKAGSHSQVLSYYKCNRVQKFAYDRCYRRGEVASRKTVRFHLTTTSSLPGIMSWSPVMDTRDEELGAVATAVYEIEKKKQDLQALVEKYKAENGTNFPISMLEMKLKGILCPEVNKGLSEYEEAFLSLSYAMEHPEEREGIELLRNTITNLVLTLKEGVKIYGSHSAFYTRFMRHLTDLEIKYCGRNHEDTADPELSDFSILVPSVRSPLSHSVSSLSLPTSFYW